ncbi:sortase [Patescibacteria group bacterium]|nr:sortase [Patescibacteria group bacterium]
MPPENLPTMETEIENNSYQGDWWLLKMLHQSDIKHSDFIQKIKNHPSISWWKLSLSSTLLLLLMLVGLNYSYKNRENIIALFPTTSEYALATIHSVNIFPEFFSNIANKYDLAAAMIYLKRIGSRDDGNTIIINEGREETVLEKPLRIKISKIGVNTLVNNPTKNDLDTLNESLNLGAVRYPNSGLLGENKNVFIFGHSTSLETEKDYYKTFNGLDTLSKGDEIIVESLNNSYVYKVTSIKETNTADGAIRIDSETQKLTLSTCNTLGAKEDRHVIEADFVKITPLTNTPTTPIIGGNTVSPTPITPNAGVEENRVYRTDPVTPIINNLYGSVDLEATIDEVGYLNSNNDLVATSTLVVGKIGAVKFTVKNIGNKTSDGWTFNAVLPTSPSHIFHSEGQKILAPGEKIEFTLGFDKLRIGEQMPIIINVDPTGGMKESNKTNNIVKAFINILEI